jgi:hypothetical protein
MCAQVSPPGMHMLHLCYADDIREPERDPAFVGPGPHPVASEEQIAAAGAMLDKLQLGPETFPGMFANPMLQRHYQARLPWHSLLALLLKLIFSLHSGFGIQWPCHHHAMTGALAMYIRCRTPLGGGQKAGSALLIGVLWQGGGYCA